MCTSGLDLISPKQSCGLSEKSHQTGDMRVKRIEIYFSVFEFRTDGFSQLTERKQETPLDPSATVFISAELRQIPTPYTVYSCEIKVRIWVPDSFTFLPLS